MLIYLTNLIKSWSERELWPASGKSLVININNTYTWPATCLFNVYYLIQSLNYIAMGVRTYVLQNWDLYIFGIGNNNSVHIQHVMHIMPCHGIAQCLALRMPWRWMCTVHFFVKALIYSIKLPRKDTERSNIHVKKVVGMGPLPAFSWHD